MLKKGYQCWVVIVNGQALAVFDNLAPAEKYIKNHNLENATISRSIYL